MRMIPSLVAVWAPWCLAGATGLTGCAGAPEDTAASEAVVPVDEDGDGSAAESDCDDADPTIHPGAEEVWYDGIDQDCDGADDFDADGDGDPPPEHGGGDCDDFNAARYSGSVSLERSDGTWADLTADFDGELVLFEAGIVRFCGPSTHLVRLTIGASGVELHGEGADVTILDADRRGAVVSVEGHTGIVLQDLTLRGAGASAEAGLVSRGAEVTVDRVSLIDNSGSRGGGVFVDGGSLTVTDSAVTENTSAYDGGGLSVRDADRVSITSSRIADNTAEDDRGGGVYARDSDLVVTSTRLEGNLAAESGGGLVFRGDDNTLQLADSVFHANLAQRGGALASDTDSATVRDTVFTENHAFDGGSSFTPGEGGVMYGTGTIAFDGCTFEGNSAEVLAGGFLIFCAEYYNVDELTLIDADFADNTPQDVFNGCDGRSYTFGEGTTVTCDNGGCR